MLLLTGPTVATHKMPDPLQEALGDRRLEKHIEHALKDVGCHPLRQIRVTSNHGQITLEGVVPTYYLKQIAQSIAMRFDAVIALENNLIVQ